MSAAFQIGQKVERVRKLPGQCNKGTIIAASSEWVDIDWDGCAGWARWTQKGYAARKVRAL